MRGLARFSVLALLLLLLPATHAAQVRSTGRSVTKAGTNSGNCAATPCLTIAYALTQMASGDTLTIGNGTYTEGIEGGAIPSGVDDANRTRLQAANDGMVTINGQTSDNYVLHITTRNYVTIHGINVDGSGHSGLLGVVAMGGDGALPSNGSNYLTLEYGKVIGDVNSMTCIGTHGYPAGRSTHLTWSHLEVYNCGVGTGNTTIHGIYPNAADLLIEYNFIHDVSGQGVQLYSSDGSEGIDRAIVRGNVVQNTGSECLRAGSGVNQSFYNNVGSNCGFSLTSAGLWIASDANSTLAYNNTFYGNTGSCINNVGSSFVIAQNNICYMNSNNALTGTYMTSTNNLTTNPSFVNNGVDFHLMAGSAAIGAAVNLFSTFTLDADQNLRPSTGAWDAGAYVFSVSAPGQIPLEAFNYTSGVDMASQNGGSFWTMPWTNGGSSPIVVQAGPSGSPSGGNAAKSINPGGAWTAYYDRFMNVLSAASDQTIPLFMNVTTCSPTTGGIHTTLRFSGSDVMLVRISGGNFNLYDNAIANFSIVAACTPNAWHKVEFNFNNSVQPNKYRARVDGGTYSSYVTVAGGTLTSIDKLALYDTVTDAHTAWWDDIGSTAAAPDLLVFSSQPTDVVTGSMFAPPVSVTANLAAGGPDAAFTGSVTLNLNSCGATSTGTATQTAAAGTATFAGLGATTAATGCIYTATSTGLTAITSSSFNVTSAVAIAGGSGRGALRKR